MNSELKKNASGYNDPTAYKAISHIDEEAKATDIRFYKLLHTIFHVCELAGFELEGRVTLKDKKTGRVYK